MVRKNTISFILDSFDLYEFDDKYSFKEYNYCYSYFDTEKAIKNHIDNIYTYDIGHLSFDLCAEYDVFIGYNGKLYQFKLGMITKNGMVFKCGHDLVRLFINGELDNDLEIDRKKYLPNK